MDRTVIPTENLTQRVPLPGIALRDPWMTMGEADPGKVLAWFNASSVVHKGTRWLAYRVESKRWFLWSRICLCKLDVAFNPIPGTDRLLPLHTRFDDFGAEDPRLFVFNGGLFLSYGDGYRMLLAQLDDHAGKIVRCGPIPEDAPDKNPPQKHTREKNFGFFEFDGRLLCQYSVCPTVTLEFDPKTWTVINRWESPWRWQSPYGVSLHGGAPPVFHNGLLWRWVHTHRSERLPVERSVWWSDKKIQTANRYYPHLISFQPEPPFTPVAVSGPIFHSEWEPPTSDGPVPYSVCYVGSSEREGDNWRLVYGENDARICTALVSDKLATAKMSEIAPPKPKKIRHHARNFLHQIWLQGEEALPPEDAARIAEWRAMNPDWEVRVWDDDSLAEVIATKAPQWVKLWESLADLRESRPDDLALMAKASDLGRLILLSIRFSGEQAWNAYADTDTRPHRPLTEFLSDDLLYGANLPKHPAYSVSPSEKEWDSDDYDMLVSEENLYTPHRGFLTNAVMLARPGALAITALLKAGLLTRSRPTLQAWGPIMLRQSIEALKRTPDGRRIAVMPFHYFVWNPCQMQQEQPAWSVCSHLNAFRWKQAGVRASQAGTGRNSRILQ